MAVAAGDLNRLDRINAKLYRFVDQGDTGSSYGPGNLGRLERGDGRR
jgi:molecular chaperone DnaK